jgi:CDP-diacylglycerol--serine O-phosphatidyltransferase
MAFIVMGAVFDFFDGFVARLLHVSSAIGKELDSLADCITFGFAPAAIVSGLLGLAPLPIENETVALVVPYLAFIIAAFSALRLAKFNIDTTQATEFTGLPTPANALMLMSLAVLATQGKVTLFQEQILVISVAASLLLISPIRMFALKFKGFGWRGNELRYGFLLTALLIIILAPAYSILAIIVLYIALSTMRWLFTRNRA